MDALLFIFAFQLAILLLLLAYSIEGDKIPSFSSFLDFPNSLRKLFGSKEAHNIRTKITVQIDTLQDDSEKQNCKEIINLGPKLADESFDEASEQTEIDSLENDFEKLNFNELLPASRLTFDSRQFLRVFSDFLKWLKSLFSAIRPFRLQETKGRQSLNKNISVEKSEKVPRLLNSRRKLWSANRLKTQMQAGFQKSRTLVYKNEDLPDQIALHLKTQLVKLNFIIYKKKKTRPLPVIYELLNEAF